MPFLTRDIYSNYGGHLYGSAGDEVIIVSDHVDVKIVEPKKGSRFSVRITFLTDETGKVEQGNWKPAVNTVPTKKQGKKQQPLTQKLF